MSRFRFAGVFLLALASGALAGEAEWSAQTKAALAAYWRGDHLGAARLFASALAEAEAFGELDRRLASTINNLALLYTRQGRHADAEALYLRAVSIDERTLGPAHPDLATTYNNVAELYRAQARYAEAEPLYRRSLAIVEKALGPGHQQVGTTLNNLAELYRAQGRYAEAEPLYQRAYAIREKTHGPNHPDVAATLGALAELYRLQGRYAQAEPLYRRALQIEEQVFGPEHPDVATTLARMGDLQRALGKPAEAEPLYRKALTIREKALGPDHVDLARNLGSLADMYFLQGRLDDAEASYAKALRILELTLGAEHPEVGMNLYRQALVFHTQGKRELALAAMRRSTAVLAVRVAQGELRPWLGVFEDHVRLLAAATANAPAQGRAALLAESFAVAQTARASVALAQSARLTARTAAGRDSLSRYARARQDALLRLRQLDTQLLRAVARPPRDRDTAAEKRLRDEAAQARRDFLRLDGNPAGDPARQADVASPKPLELREAQLQLADDEALVMLMVLADRSFLWVVRREAAEFFPLALRRSELAEAAGRLSGQLDARGERRSTDSSAAFDVAMAHELYRRLLLPAEAMLAGAQHVMLVPDGALVSLPPGVLVTAPPAKPPASLRDLAQVDWLVKRHAVTVLPSPASLRTRALAARPSAAREAFRGYGSEMQPLAGALKVSPATLVTGPLASESNIKGTNLARFRALAFAAPGALVRGSGAPEEPALVLTEARSPNAHDNGVLTASEIAQLHLDADWVLLAGGASPEATAAEGLLTLAHSFVQAGARSVLVAYPAGSAQATAEITARVAEESAAGVAKAEALRRSMLALINATGDPQRAHPRYWANLTVVGEGNAAWSAGRRQPSVVAQPAEDKPPAAPQAEAAEKPGTPAPENQDGPIARAVAAVTSFLGQVERSRGAPPPAQAQPQMQEPPPAPSKPAPQPEPQVQAPPPPPPQLQPPPPPPPAEPAPVRVDPPAPEPVAATAEAPLPETGGANPLAQAIEGIGSALKKIFAAPAQSQPEASTGSTETAAAGSSAPVQNWSAPSDVDATPTPQAQGDDPVSQLVRQVGATLARLLAAPPVADAPAAPPAAEAPAASPAVQAPAATAVQRSEPEQQPISVPAVAVAAAPSAAVEPPAAEPPQPRPPESSTDGGDPIGSIFKELGELLTRLQLALKLQTLFEPQPAPAPEPVVQESDPDVQGTIVLSSDGKIVRSGDGRPVSSPKVDPGPLDEPAAEDDPITAAFRAAGEFLKRLLGGEIGTAPTEPGK